MTGKLAIYFLLVCLGSYAVSGDEACHVNDLRTLAVRLRELNTKTHDSTASLKDEIENLKTKNLESQENITLLNQDVENLETKNIESQENITSLNQEVEHLKMKSLNSQDNITLLYQEIENLKMKILNLETMVQNLPLNNGTQGQDTQVAFIARTSKDPTQAPYGRFFFSIVELDTSNAYSTTSGGFTAPVHGLYLFTLQICLTAGSGIYFYIWTTGHTEHLIESFHMNDSDTEGDCSSATTVAEVAEQEGVYVISGGTVGGGNKILTTGNGWTMFSGILIKEIN